MLYEVITIWIGTDGGGLNAFNVKENTFTVYTHDPKDPYSIASNVIRSITQNKNNDLIIATWDGVLNRFEKKTKRFYKETLEDEFKKKFNIDNFWSTFQDSKNRLWLVTPSLNILVYDENQKFLHHINMYPASNTALIYENSNSYNFV